MTSEERRRRFPTALRILVLVALAVGVVYLLFTVVFPWVDRNLLADPTLGVVPLLG